MEFPGQKTVVLREMEKVFSKVETTLLHNKEGFVECSARDGKDVICGSC